MLEPPDTQTRHGQHGRYPQAASVVDFRHNLAAKCLVCWCDQLGGKGDGIARYTSSAGTALWWTQPSRVTLME